MTKPRDEAGRQDRLAQRRARLSAEQRAQLASRLRGRGGPSSRAPVRTSLVAIDPTGSRRPFFCVHPAGGDVLCFHPLSRHLPAEQPFYGLQSRGLTAGQEPHTTIPEMAAHYLAEMRQVQPGGPYCIGGWSLGGLIAFEIAQQLDQQGEEAALVAIFDTTPWLAELRLPGDVFADDAWWLMAIVEYAEGLWGQDLGVTYDRLRELGPEDRLTWFADRLRAIEILPRGAGVEQLGRVLRVFKANVRAAQGYEPRPYAGRITLFRAAEAMADDGPARPDPAPLPAAADADPTLGWSQFSTRPVAVHTVPGNHVTLLADANARSLARALWECLESTQADADALPVDPTEASGERS